MSVKAAFERGVSGDGNFGPTATEISASASTGYTTHSARVEAQLDRVRGVVAQILATDDERSDEIAGVADKAIDAIADCLDDVDTARAAAEQARAEVGAKYRVDLPGIDQQNLESLRLQAEKATSNAVMKERAPALDESARAAGAACSAVELLVSLAKSTTPELDDALNAKFSPNDKASEDIAVEQLTGRSSAELTRFYANAVASKMDATRLRRLERALERVARARVGMTDAEVGKLVYAFGGTEYGSARVDAEKTSAAALFKAIADARLNRTPASVLLAEDALLGALREAFRLLCGSDRVHFESTGASTGEVLEQRAPWRPLGDWQARYGTAK